MDWRARAARSLYGNVFGRTAEPLDECFDYCHTWAMKYYLWGDEDCATEDFEACMEAYCGGM